MAERRSISPNSRGVYQSYMSSVTDEEPIVIVPTGEPRARDDQYEGPPYMFPFVLPDDVDDSDNSWFFLIENEDMFNAMVNGDEDLGVDPLPVGREIRFSVRGQGEAAQAVWQQLSDEEFAAAHGGGTNSATYPSVEDKYRDCLDVALQIADDYDVPDEDAWEFIRNVATHFSMSFRDRDLPLRTPEQPDPAEEETDDVEDEVEDAVSDEDGLPF